MKLYEKLKSKFAPDKKKLYDSLKFSWKVMSESEPYYSVDTLEQYKLENLDDEKIHQFYFSENSRFCTEYVQKKLRELSKAPLESYTEKRGCDFGCGVGRNSVHLAPYFKEFVGLDISKSYVEIASEICKKLNIPQAQFYNSNESVTQFGNFDFIFSVITLQHIPPPLMKNYIAQLLSKLNPKGIAFLHFPVSAEGYKFLEKKFLIDSSEKATWHMHVLSEKDARKIIKRERCRVLQIDKEEDFCHGKWESAMFIVEKEG